MMQLNRIRQYVSRDLWHIRARKLPRKQFLAVRWLRIFVLTARQFQEDKCQLYASALTYYTLMSIVPILAVAFGIAKGFGLEKNFSEAVLSQLPGQEVVLTRIVNFAKQMLENTRGGAIAGVGVAFLLWALVRMLGQIEDSFNSIWGVKKSRDLGSKFTDYLSLIVVLPLAFILSSSLNVFVSGALQAAAQNGLLPPFLVPLLSVVLPLLSFALIAGFLCFLYAYIPNTHVNLGSAALGGLLAAAIYAVVQFGYIQAQVFFSSYGAVYGSFAALPLFLIWLQSSWLVVLLGAEITFAHQNADTYEFEPDALQASFALKKMLAGKICTLCCDRFKAGEAPMQDAEIADALDIPVRLCRHVLNLLVQTGILSEAHRPGDARSLGYQPAIPPEAITSQRIAISLEHLGVESLPGVAAHNPHLEARPVA